MSKYTEEQKRKRKEAVRRYQQTVDRVNCMFPYGTKDRILQYSGSCNSFIKETVLKELDKLDRQRKRSEK